MLLRTPIMLPRLGKITFGALVMAVAACSSQPSPVEVPNAQRFEKAASSNAVIAQESSNSIRNDLPASQADALTARPAVEASLVTDVASQDPLIADTPKALSLNGSFSQGGLLFGKVEAGSTVRLDGMDVMVGPDGNFVVGFGRDSALNATLTLTWPDGTTERHALDLADRDFPEERIDNLDQSKVSGYTPAQLEKIGIDSKLKKAARSTTHPQADYLGGMDWPVTGRISGVFGARRILNGEPKRPHSGVDVARPTGTPVRAPASGVITLAQDGMYFEGGLILLDHGQWLESAFLHLSRIDVVPGQRVERGEIIGAVGATGRVTGPHLHWSIRWMSRLVDPQLAAGEMPKTQ